MNQERFEMLMVKVVDGFATPEEEAELQSLLDEQPELQRELDMHTDLKQVTDDWVHRLEHDLVQDKYDAGTLAKIEQGIGLTLFLLGFGVLTGGGVVMLFLDPEAPLWLKGGTGATLAGLIILLGSVIRWRLTTGKSDPYKEVIR